MPLEDKIGVQDADELPIVDVGKAWKVSCDFDDFLRLASDRNINMLVAVQSCLRDESTDDSEVLC
jgi:hypothetical protein